MKSLIVAIAGLIIVGCSHFRENISEITEMSFFDSSAREPSSEVVSTQTLFITQINTAEEFNSIGEKSAGVIRQGRTIKFLIDNRNPKSPSTYFLNANYCPTAKCATPPKEAIFHYEFAKKQLKVTMSQEAYYQTTYYSTTLADRMFFDGRIQEFTIKENGQETSYYGIRFIERDLINAEMVQYAVTQVQKNLKIPQYKLAVLISSDTQDVTSIQPWLSSQNVKVYTMEQVLSGISYIGLNPGEAYGFVRMFPENEEDLEPFDIPVFASLPLDLSVVAGTISTEYQDVGSHINLKSKERGTPNMVLRDPAQVAKLKALNGQPVYLKVDYSGFNIKVVDSQLVYDAYKKKTAGPWTAVEQVDASALVNFDEMCKNELPKKCLEKSRSYGGKVAGLGFLSHPSVAGTGSSLEKKFGYRLIPVGYGVPLKFYNEFIKLNYNKNTVLREALNKLVTAEMSLKGAAPLTPVARRELVKTIQTEILKGEIPQELYEKAFAELANLKARVGKLYPGIELDKLKIRSSSNAEDIKGFNGAGLHDSYSAKISLSTATDAAVPCTYVMEKDADTGLEELDVNPKNLACAMKGAYASLWNVRAVRERTYKKFDHRTASMGLSVQTSYKFRKGPKIRANSVMVTRVLGTENVYGQQLSTQVGNGLVTNPVPNTKSELAVIAFDSTTSYYGINILQYAKPLADQPTLTNKILSREDMLKLSQIGSSVEVKYCEAIPEYFPGNNCKAVVNSQKKALALDMEFKIYDNNEFLIKQVRTFSGR